VIFANFQNLVMPLLVLSTQEHKHICHLDALD